MKILTFLPKIAELESQSFIFLREHRYIFLITTNLQFETHLDAFQPLQIPE
jgi:hypothetical protein